MLHVICSGSPSEIGFQHGQQAKTQIQGSISFYQSFFQETSQISWDEACSIAEKWLPYLEAEWPDFIEEIKGIATGASQPFTTILALNVRTEIAYGLFTTSPATDGCTSFSMHSPVASSRPFASRTAFLAQTWDWRAAQRPNLIHLTIRPASDSKPSIETITEAGILAKIGLNSAGIGVCLNAVKAGGVAYDKLPVHLALRAVLECGLRDQDEGSGNGEETGRDRSEKRKVEESPGVKVEDALSLLRVSGVASSAHILIADERVSAGVETSAKDVVAARDTMYSRLRSTTEEEKIDMKVVLHTNHFTEKHHEEVKEVLFLPDSTARLQRLQTLVMEQISKGDKAWNVEALSNILTDQGAIAERESGKEVGEGAIWKGEEFLGSKAESVTLFRIVMDLREHERKGWVWEDRGTGDVFELDPRRTDGS